MALIRDIHPDTLAALTAGAFHPALLVFVDWPGDPARAHTGTGTITWGGHDWLGLASLGTVELPEESAGSVASADAVLGIAGTMADLLALPGQSARNADVQIWSAVVTAPQGNVLIGAPWPLFTGVIASDSLDGVDAEGGIDATYRLGLRGGVSARLPMSDVHSPEDQAALHPGDTAFEHAVFSGRQLRNPPRW